jgi:hypothetical protein
MLCTERHVGIGAVRRLVEAYTGCSTSLCRQPSSVERASDVAADVGVRLLQRVAHPGLCARWMTRANFSRQNPRASRIVGQIELLKASPAAPSGAPAAPAWASRRSEVVQAHDFVAAREQRARCASR